MKKIKLNQRWDIVLPDHRADRPEYHLKDGWEAKRLLSMYEKIGDGDVVYYIGTEEGEMPALLQIWGAKVYLFEPNPKVWPNIKSIWEANKLDTPVCWPGFASNRDNFLGRQIKQEWPLAAEKEVIGNHGFKELYLEAGNYPEIRIDGVSYYMPDKPTALSIDVEGSEWRVLEGAERTLKDYKPKIWLSGHPEFMYNQWNEYLGDLRGWIKGFGYREELLDYQHEVHLYYEAL